MYYSSVNRGLSLTNSGKYTVVLTLALGLIAMASGLNAIFLAVSFLMAAIVISGVMSERVMKNLNLRGSPRFKVLAKTPFQIDLTLDTGANFPGLAGLECELFTEKPQRRFLSRWSTGIGSASRTCLVAGKTEAFGVPVSGLERGRLSELPVVLVTTFPFGILRKFKLSSVSSDILVLPEKHQPFEEFLRQQLGLFRSRSEEKESFFSHRTYRNQDSVRLVDWKKSAGRDVPRWVTKEFEGGAPNKTYVVDPDWERIRFFADETSYEGFLSVISTALCLLQEHHQEVSLLLSDATVEKNSDKALAIIATAPRFPKHASIKLPVGGTPLPEDAVVISIQNYREFFS